MFFLYPYIKKMKGGEGGAYSRVELVCLIFWPSKWAPSFGGSHLLESELPKMWQ